MTKQDMDKKEIADMLNQFLGLSGKETIRWEKLSMKELFVLYNKISSIRQHSTIIGTGDINNVISAGKEKVAEFIDSMSADEIKVLMDTIDKRREQLKEKFPILSMMAKRFLDNTLGDKKD